MKHRATEQALRLEYTIDQLLRATGFLRLKNQEGFDVYARPAGWQFVLLDDLTRPVLADLADLKPCALLETSPNNYQAWLILSHTPTDRQSALAICRVLAKRFGADPASADPDHVGRLPGFTNRKPKHQMSNGHYPYVRLHRSAYRLSTFHPFGGGVLEAKETILKIPRSNCHSHSEQDFGVACGLIRKGLTDQQIYDYLLITSNDIVARKGSKHVQVYLERTIRNARRANNP